MGLLIKNEKKKINAFRYKSPLCYSCYSGNMEMVKLVLKHNFEDFDEGLIGACTSNKLDIVKLMVEKGANVNTLKINGTAAIHIAAKNGNFEILKFLVKKGADIKIEPTKYGYREANTLHFACEGGNIDIVKFLVENGLNVNQKDNREYLPMHFAIKNQHVDIVKYLISVGANENGSNSIALQLACDVENKEIVLLLLEKGANVSFINKSYYYCSKALGVACRKGNTEIVDILLEHGADVNAKTRSGTTLSIAKYNPKMFCHLLTVPSLSFATIESTKLYNPNKECAELLEDFKKGKLWTKERHKYFSKSIKQSIFNFLVCLKINKKNRSFIPRPIAIKIVSFIANPAFYQSFNVDGKIDSNNKRKESQIENERPIKRNRVKK